MPKVSVIIPTHNREKLLSKAVGSVIEQTFQDFEVIIVDDGSTDNTRKVISEFSAKDERILYIYQQNQGVASARNKGISIARGAYIAFLDSDDRMLPNRLEEQVKLLDINKNIGLVYGSMLIKENEESELKTFGIVFPEIIPCREMFLNLLKYHIFFTICTVMMRKDIFEKYNFNPLMKIGEDFLFFLQVSRDYLFYGLDKPLAIINRSGDLSSLSKNNNQFNVKLALDILKFNKHDTSPMSIPL